jgi:replicative DNA helicase
VNTFSIDTRLPADIAAEKTILGAILLDNDAFWDRTADLKVDEFLLDAHQRIFRAMNDIFFGLVEGMSHVDLITLATTLQGRKEIESVGGVAYLSSLTEGLPRRTHVEEYVRIVSDKARLRRVIMLMSAGISRAVDQSETSERIISDLETDLLTLHSEGSEHAVDIGSVAPDIEADVEIGRRLGSERTALQFTWGLKGLDEKTRGAFPGEMTILAADSSGGKTAMIVQMLIANAQEGTNCCLFSPEMTKAKVVRRFYPAMSEIITSSHMRDPRLMNLHTHIPEMRRISSELRKLPIKIDDTSPLHIDKLIARMRMMRRKYGTKLFGIDYLQLLEPPAKMNETTGFKYVVMALIDFVKIEPDCHIVVLSQYSKSDGFTKSKRRTKDSLYGGSVIHHAAQNVLMISVEDPDKRDDRDLLDAEIRIAKQRDGRRGKVSCYFDRDRLLFTYPIPPLTGA